MGTRAGAAHGWVGHRALVQKPLEALGALTPPGSASETPPVTVERSPGTLAPSYATVGHDPRGAWLPQPPKALLSRRHFLPATNADHSELL